MPCHVAPLANVKTTLVLPRFDSGYSCHHHHGDLDNSISDTPCNLESDLELTLGGLHLQPYKAVNVMVMHKQRSSEGPLIILISYPFHCLFIFKNNLFSASLISVDQCSVSNSPTLLTWQVDISYISLVKS